MHETRTGHSRNLRPTRYVLVDHFRKFQPLAANFAVLRAIRYTGKVEKFRTHWRRCARNLALLAFCLLSLALFGCERDGAPELISVTELAPKQVEAGERLEISGTGFPRGRTARVTFRGTLHRPAAPPIHGASIAADGMVVSAERIDIPFGENLEALFSNDAGERGHTTFEGTVEVVLAAAVRGAPPIAGAPLSVSLDVRPSSMPADRIAILRDEGRRLLDFVGLEVSTTNVGRGVSVVNVRPGSKAEAAGLLPGDVLVSADGVVVHEVSDMASRLSSPDMTLVVHKGEGEGERGESRLTLDLRGFRSASALEYLPALVVTTLAAALLLILFAPPFVVPESLVRKFSHRARGTAQSKGATRTNTFLRTLRETLYGDLVDGGATPFKARLIAYGGAAFALVAVLAIPYAQATTNIELDVVGLFLVAMATLLTSTIAFGGASRSWKRRFEDLVAVALVNLPIAVSILGIVTTSGSLRLRELVRTQGAMPWDWAVVRTPASVALFAAFVLALVLDPWASREPASFVRNPLTEVDRTFSTSASMRHASRYPVTFVLGWSRTFAFAAIGSALFLGGWNVPFAPPGTVESNLVVASIASVIFVAKVLVLVVAVVAVERALPELSLAQRVSVALRVIVPLSAIAFVIATVWVRWTLPRSAEIFVRTSLFCALTVATVHLVWRAIAKIRRPEAEAHLNPFL